MFVATVLSDQIINTIKTQIESYTVPLNIPKYNNYSKSAHPDQFVDSQLPSCVVFIPGTQEASIQRVGGSYEAEWAVGVMSVVSGSNEDATISLQCQYAAIIREIMLKSNNLDGFVDNIAWDGEAYDEMLFDDSRTIAVAVSQFNLLVEDLTDSKYNIETDRKVLVTNVETEAKN